MLKREVTSETETQVKVVYLNRRQANFWNAHRDPDDTVVFCGFYWIRGREEAGPFRSRSAAIRDAYYRFVLNTEPPKAVAIRSQGVKTLPAPKRANGN